MIKGIGDGRGRATGSQQALRRRLPTRNQVTEPRSLHADFREEPAAAGVAGRGAGRAGRDATGRLYHAAVTEPVPTGPLSSNSWRTGAPMPSARPQSQRAVGQGLLEKILQKR